MYSSIVVVYLLARFCIFSTTLNFSSGSLESTWLTDLKSKVSCPTPDPVNINTSTAQIYKPPTVLTVTVGLLDRHIITNTGYGVQVTNTGPLPILTTVTGGPLETDIYTIDELQYFWAPSYDGAAGGTIDGIGAAVQSRAIFINNKYATKEEALYKRNGFAIAVFNIQSEGFLNATSFAPFGEALQKIRKAGSSMPISAPPVFLWFNELNTVQYYYSYEGAYFDLKNKAKQYYCATIIEFPKSFQPGISIPDYLLFTQLLDYSNKTYINDLKPAPFGSKRTLRQIYGDTEIILPA